MFIECCFLVFGLISSFGTGGGLEITGSVFRLIEEIESSSTLDGSALQTSSVSQLGVRGEVSEFRGFFGRIADFWLASSADLTFGLNSWERRGL